MRVNLPKKVRKNKCLSLQQSIVRLQETLPKLGREKMESFNTDCKTVKEMIDFEMKTTEDYINNMDIKEKLEERLRALQVFCFEKKNIICDGRESNPDQLLGRQLC
jgi:hypothetical protein